MKIKLSKVQWEEIGRKSGWIKTATRRKDQFGNMLAHAERYFLRRKKHGPDDPYFFGGGSIFAPKMVYLPADAEQFSGSTLSSMAYDWTMNWDAVAVRTPNRTRL